MKQLLKKSSILFFLTLFCVTLPAQETQKTLVASNLVLEVTYLKGNSPASQRIGENSASKNSAWYSLFGKIPNWQPKKGDFPVRAVNIVPYFEGNSVKIRVFVFIGENFRDKEVFVADVNIRENEKKAVTELTKFGVEPFELAIVQNALTTAFLPMVVNKTNSLQVMVEPNVSTLPSFKVKILNNSNKSVSACALETLAGERKLLSGMPQGRDGEALIAPNEIFETVFRNTLQGTKNESEQSLMLVISFVVFEDGSYEGDAPMAAQFLAFVVGRKILLKQAVPLWQKAFESKTPNESLVKLSEQLSALKMDVDENSLMELIGEFPSLSDKDKGILRIAIQSSIKGTKFDMLRALENFNANLNKTDESAQMWLKESKERYENWLTRLTK